MNDKLMYLPNDVKNSNPFLLIKTIGGKVWTQKVCKTAKVLSNIMKAKSLGSGMIYNPMFPPSLQKMRYQEISNLLFYNLLF